MNLISIIIGFGYVGIATAVFAESGLLIGFFLPGDSLLFTAGFLASQGIFRIEIIIAVCVIAAIAGDSAGYAFGRRVGPKLFRRVDSLLFNRDHLERSRLFFERRGAAAIVLARFMPIVRTFTPILAGVGVMRYGRFLVYNVIGGILWAVGLPAIGYTLGQTIPGVDQYLLPIIAGIIIVSIAPGLLHILRNDKERARFLAAARRVFVRT